MSEKVVVYEQTIADQVDYEVRKFLHNTGGTLKYADGLEHVRETKPDLFRDYIFEPRSKCEHAGDVAHVRAVEFMSAHPGVEYKDALEKVFSDAPMLRKSYEQADR